MNQPLVFHRIGVADWKQGQRALTRAKGYQAGMFETKFSMRAHDQALLVVGMEQTERNFGAGLEYGTVLAVGPHPVLIANRE